MAPRVEESLWGGALALASVAAALLVWPVSGRVPEPPPRAVARPPAAAPTSLGAVDDVVRVDVFAEGHAPPRARWAPPPADTLPPGLAPDPLAAESSGEPEPIDPPRFYGTVSDARGVAALVRFPGASASELLHTGDRARGWRVLAVAPDRVTVAAPGGERLTLRLPRPSP